MKSQGFILPMVMAFLLVFSLLGVSLALSAMTMLKAVQDSTIRQAAFNHARWVLKKLENLGQDCLIPATSSAEIASKSLEWWKESACSGIFTRNQYYYVVEFLENDPCAIIVKDEAQVTADYYRISLLYLAEKNIKILLQSSIVKPSQKSVSCENARDVSIGRQMWRDISSLSS